MLQPLTVTLLDLLIWIPHKRSASLVLGLSMVIPSKTTPSMSEIINVSDAIQGIFEYIWYIWNIKTDGYGGKNGGY